MLPVPRDSVPHCGRPSPIGTPFELSSDQGPVGKVTALPTRLYRQIHAYLISWVLVAGRKTQKWCHDHSSSHSGIFAAASHSAKGERSEHHTHMHTILTQHSHASRPMCACFWNCLMCASPYIPFCRPRPGAEQCFIQVIPTKVPTSISSSSVPTVSPNAPRPHPIPFPKTYSPHRRALSYAFMSRLCRTSMRLCFSIVRGAADFEQQRSSIIQRAATFAGACARARSCRGVWNV